MEEPSTSHFDIDYFFNLPWHVQRSILSNLTPVDLLNLAEADESFRELVRSHPKRLHSITTNCDLNIEVHRNGITRRFWRDYYTDTYHPKKIERFRRDEMQSYSLVFCAGEERRIERDYELLLSNCKLDVFEAPAPKYQNLGIVATHIENPEVDTIDELINMLDALKATELNLLQNDYLLENNESVDKFLSNEKVLALKCLNMNIGEGNLHKFAEIMIPKLLLYVHDHTDGIGLLLLSLTEQLIQQWEQNEREIDMVLITLETDEEFGEDEIENILNFEINEMAHQLAFGRLGTFKEKTIDRRFKLIKRLDGTGLLIMTGAISVALIKCDYSFRRERGLGTAHRFETLRNTLENLLYQLRVTEESEERLRRYGKEPVKEYPEEVVDSVAFSIFGIETLEDEYSYEEQEASRDEKLGDGDKEDKEKSKDKIFADLKVALKELDEYRKNITLRELSIDQLWDTTEPQISKGTLRSLVSGLRGDEFPAMPVHDRPEQRYVLEYADECIKAGRLRAYYESN